MNIVYFAAFQRYNLEMKQIWISETVEYVGQTIELYGWAQTIRNHGKVIFIDLRDRSGILQCVVTDKNESFQIAKEAKPESVIWLKGQVQKRPPNLVNPNLPTGEIELAIEQFQLLSAAQPPPLPLETNGYEVDEAIRLKYRFLDLRRSRLLKNLEKRHRLILFIRHWLAGRGFIEIETPILTKSTPEGARDYLVPTRDKGKFFALPQSPQQYKQLLMVAGIERYFQIARCFRDEDARGDRQPEFTQLDLEASFVSREDMIAINEALLIEIIEKLYPEKKIQQEPFPRLSYQEVMEKYQTDRPDLRQDKNDSNLLAFCWVIDFPFFKIDAVGGWTFTHNPFSAPKSEHLEWLLNQQNIEQILTTQYDIVLNGLEIGGGSIRNHQPKALRKVFEIIGLNESNIIENFGHILEAFTYGVPPHGGIAWGFDRLISILENEPNIREVIAFPKTSEGRDPMMASPSQVEEAQLEELGLKQIPEK